MFEIFISEPAHMVKLKAGFAEPSATAKRALVPADIGDEIVVVMT
jgi:hypothetical protein